MTERKSFGGKSPTAINANLLPMMEEYLDHLVELDRGNMYITATRLAMKHFSNFAEENGLRYPDEIERRHLLRYQLWLQSLKTWNGTATISVNYQGQLMKSIRAWLNWLVSIRYLDSSPWVDIPYAQERIKPQALTGEEVERLFEAHKQQAFTISPFYYHRREVILVLLYGWGLHVNELQGLTVSALDMRQDWVTIPITSIDRPRSKTLPYTPELKAAVQRWLAARGSRSKPGEDALLIDREGKRLSQQMIQKIVTELGHRANVRPGPRVLRGAFAQILLSKDVDLDHVMKMMGHATRESTRAFMPEGDPEIEETYKETMGPILRDLL